MLCNRSCFAAFVAGAMILLAKVTIAQTAPDEDLIHLAHKHLPYDSIPDEEKNTFNAFFQRTQDGEKFDVTPKRDSVGNEKDWEILTDPTYADSWPKDRIVKAEWLVWICTDPQAAAKVTSKGIEIVGARIDGQVALAYAKTQFPLRTCNCAFKEDIILDRCTLRSLQLRRTQIKGLQGQGLTVEGDILLSDGFQAVGIVSLKDATIGGALNCNDGQFFYPGGQFIKLDAQALNLEGARIGAVYLRKVRAEGGVRLFGATIAGNLDCDEGQFINAIPKGQALSLEGARISSVYLRNIRAVGLVWLFGATITGNLECDGGQFINPFADGQALSLEDAKTGAVILRNARVEGGGRFFCATISGNLECDNSQFVNPRGQALNLEGAKTGAVYLRNGFRAEGELWLRKATIVGDLDCDNGHFINFNPGKSAITADLVNVQGSVRLVNGFKADGSVSFREAQVDHEFLLKDANWHENATLDLSAATVKTLLNLNNWPKHLLLDGMTFDKLGTDAELTAEAQLRWIRLQPSKRFLSQPYEQMAKVFRNMGRQEEAVDVLIEENGKSGCDAIHKDLRHIKKNGWGAVPHFLKLIWDIFWYGFFGWSIAYGYRPWNALFLSFFMIALGAFRFRNGYKAQIIIPAKDDAWIAGAEPRQLKPSYPRFSAIIYSLEKFVPLVKLDVGDLWTPDANQRAGRWLRRYLWFHILMGWLLTTLWIGSLTGLIKS
jgi:hypothetical protein